MSNPFISNPFVQKLRIGALLSLVFVFAAPDTCAHAWGVTGHHYINNLAVDCLPKEIKPLYEANRAWITQHSTDPDDWRNDSSLEGIHHFIDLDTLVEDPLVNFPEDYWAAVGRFGQAAVDKNGVVPWRISLYYGKLVRAFKQKDARSIIEMSSWLGHYAADIHVPFHATANYDGQLSGQKGIHARFESVMVEKLIKPQDLKPKPVSQIKDPVASAFQWAGSSLALCPAILDADKAGVLKDADYGDNYYLEFGRTARPIAVRRLEEGAHDVASLWYSAWISAGRPNLPSASDVHGGEPLDKRTHDPDLALAKPEQARPAEIKTISKP